MCGKQKKIKSKKKICWEVSVNNPGGIRGVSQEEEKEGYVVLRNGNVAGGQD